MYEQPRVVPPPRNNRDNLEDFRAAFDGYVVNPREEALAEEFWDRAYRNNAPTRRGGPYTQARYRVRLDGRVSIRALIKYFLDNYERLGYPISLLDTVRMSHSHPDILPMVNLKNFINGVLVDNQYGNEHYDDVIVMNSGTNIYNAAVIGFTT